MPLLDPRDPRPVHFVGIAGAGMRALAELLARRGAAVQGTDAHPDDTGELAALGIVVTPPSADAVDNARAVVYSSAVPVDHPELVAARARGLPVVRRAEALGEAIAGHHVVAVAGTHGKTTTTVMTTEAFVAAGREATGIAGGRVASWGGNLRAGAFDPVVVEADEYDRSFLALTPTIAVILNVEADHLDIYRDAADVSEAFAQFLRPARAVVLCADDAGAAALPMDATREVVRYAADVPGAVGVRDARLVARDVRAEGGGMRARVVFDGREVGELVLAVPGVHNVRNALAAIGAGILLGVAPAAMLPGLAAFGGVARRFEVKGRTDDDVLVVDDYAHHPTEVAATIAAARAAHPARRLVVAFQPHLYSRTRDFAGAFADALSGADVVLLCDLYPAREAPIAGVSSALISDALAATGRAPAWCGPRTACATALATLVRSGDLVVTMGAGDVTGVGPSFLAWGRA